MFKLAKIKKMRLDSAAWSVGGGMQGGHNSIAIKRQEDGSINIITESQEWHNSDLTKVTYTVSEEVMDEVKRLIIAANVPKLDKRGFSKYRILDGDTYSFSCFFTTEDDYESFYVHQEQKMSKAEANKLHAILDYLSNVDKGKGIEEIIPGEAKYND